MMQGPRAQPLVFRWMLRLYPEPFRRRFGRELAQIWRLDGQEAHREGNLAAVHFWLIWSVTTSLDAVAQRLRRDPSLRLPPPAAKERLRMDLLRQDLVFALRTLRQRPAWTAAVVATLGIGLGATIAVFSIVNDALLRPLPYDEAERLVIVDVVVHESMQDMVSSFPAFETYRDAQEGLSSLEAWADVSATVDTGNGPGRREVAWTSAGLLGALSVAPTVGRPFTPDDDQVGSEPVAMLSFRLWQQDFGGDPAVLGQRIEIDEVSHTVVAVLPAGFGFPNPDVDVWLPMSGVPRNRDFFFLQLLGRLDDGVDLQQVQARFASLSLDVSDGSRDGTLSVFLRATPMQEDLVGDLRPQLSVFLAAVVAVLLIACLNVAHLMLTRAIGRRRELALRAALGAGRARLVRQLVVESTLLGVLGGGLGAALAAIILEGLRLLGPQWMPRPEQLGLDGTALAFALVLALGVGAGLGLLTAIRASSVDPSLGLTDARGEVSGAGGRLRAALIVSQLAGAVVLVGIALLLVQSFRGLADRESGFNTEHVMMIDVELPDGRYGEQAQQHAYYQELLDQLRALPGVESATAASSHPFIYYLGYPLVIDGHVPVAGERIGVRVRLVTDGYAETTGVHLLEGRFIEERDGTAAVVINKSLADQYFPEGAIGRRVRLSEEASDPWRTVVGVVADVEHYARHPGFTSSVYLPITGVDYPFQLVPMIRTENDPLTLAGAVRERIAGIDPRVPVGAMTRLDDLVWRAKSMPRLRTTLLGAFGGVALLLSAIGLYAVLAFWVEDRRREMGVRLALGADRSRIVRQVLGHGFQLVAIGIAIGSLLTWPALVLLRSRLTELAPWQGSLQATAIAVLVLAALLACWLPARRAAGVDPITALRQE